MKTWERRVNPLSRRFYGIFSNEKTCSLIAENRYYARKCSNGAIDEPWYHELCRDVTYGIWEFTATGELDGEDQIVGGSEKLVFVVHFTLFSIMFG